MYRDSITNRERNYHMDPVTTAIVTALSAGIIAGLRDDVYVSALIRPYCPLMREELITSRKYWISMS